MATFRRLAKRRKAKAHGASSELLAVNDGSNRSLLTIELVYGFHPGSPLQPLAQPVHLKDVGSENQNLVRADLAANMGTPRAPTLA